MSFRSLIHTESHLYWFFVFFLVGGGGGGWGGDSPRPFGLPSIPSIFEHNSHQSNQRFGALAFSAVVPTLQCVTSSRLST